MKISLNIVLNAMAAIIIATIAFYAGRLSVSSETDKTQVLEDEKSELLTQAEIVKRVSLQMEDIAYQQKEVSDHQRERAEEQSKLALANAERAEMESRLARDAEQKAINALREADAQRANAVRQEGLAKEQLAQARLQKSITDTLSFRTMGRTIGRSAITFSNSGDHELAQTLAYASYYFINRYNGNTHITECFQALAATTDSQVRYNLQHKSPVNAICSSGKLAAIAVTGYGEIMKMQYAPQFVPKMLFKDKSYDFRDVKAGSDGKVYALSYNGKICIISPDGTIMKKETQAEKCKKIFMTSNNTCVIVGEKSITWYQPASGKETTRTFDKTISASFLDENGITELYFKNGTYATALPSGEVKSAKSPVTGEVTAVAYEPTNGFKYYGFADGAIHVKNKHNNHLDLVGHTARITSIAVSGDFMAATSYDHQLHFWDMTKLHYPNANSLYSTKSFYTQSSHDKNITPTEWQVPTNLEYTGWPLTVTFDQFSKTIWVGSSDGGIELTCTSTDDMANTLKKSLKRNLTTEEWEQYIGIGVPYIDFLKKP